MKRYGLIVLICLLAHLAFGQGTLIYDQQSAGEGQYLEGSMGLVQPVGQSFTPAFDSIDFFRLFVYGSGPPCTVFGNLRANSITGSVVGVSAPLSLNGTFSGPITLLFSNSISLIPGTTYYLQPVAQSPVTWGTYAGQYGFAGGDAYYQGSLMPNVDLWFREGITPEPSSGALLILGGCTLFWSRRSRSRG